jgi:hypothetical protein
MGLPSILLIPRRRIRGTLAGLSVLALVWSSSRGSLLALGMMILAVLLLKLFKRHRFGAGLLIVLAAMALVCVLPFLTHDPTAYTNRGHIWQQSLLAWSVDEVWGLGSAWYALVGASSEALGATVFHGHNQLVQLLVTGGYALAFLVGGRDAAARVGLRGQAGPQRKPLRGPLPRGLRWDLRPGGLIGPGRQHAGRAGHHRPARRDRLHLRPCRRLADGGGRRSPWSGAPRRQRSATTRPPTRAPWGAKSLRATASA